MRKRPPRCLIIPLLLLGSIPVIQAQPGLARPAGAASVPGIAAAQPAAGATAAGAQPPGIPQAVTPAATPPNVPGAATPGGPAGGVALVPDGAGVLPGQPAMQKPPGIPAATTPAQITPAAGLVNPAAGAVIPGVTPAVTTPSPGTPAGNPATPGPSTPGGSNALLGPAGLNNKPATATPGPGTPGPGIVGTAGPINPAATPGPGGVGLAGPVNPVAVQAVTGTPVPSPAVAAAAAGTAAVANPAVGAAAATSGDLVVPEVLPTLGPIIITPSATTVRSSYTWSVSKRFSDQSKSKVLSIAATTGTDTVNYQLTVTKSLATQAVTVAGTFAITGSGNFPTPTLTFAPAPSSPPAGTVSCIPANTAPATCTFSQTWNDVAVAAAAGGVLTVSIGTSTQTAPYNFAGVTGGTTGNCAVVSDTFTAGQLTGSNMQMTGNYPPSGLQICDSGDKTYEYAVTFSNLEPSWCSTPLTVANTATVTPTDGGAPVSDSSTATITISGCTGADPTNTLSSASAVTVSNIKTVVVNTYTWVLENTGGGAGLTTTPDKELIIPFTTTATQTLQSGAGWVSGSVSITNTAQVAITLTSFTVDLGSGGVSQPVSQCQTSSVAVGSATSCAFNVSAPSAPAAGSVTATVDYSLTTTTGASTASGTSAATAYSFTAADTYNTGSQATLYLAIDASSLSTLTGVWGTNNVQTANSLVRVEPPDAAPPLTPPGITVSQTTAYTYNVIVSKLLTCMDSRTLTNTATLTPLGGQAQTKSAGATFSVTGCNVLPTVSLSNIQTFAAVTYSWSMTKTANPTQVQIPVGGGGSTQYTVQLTRTRSTANYAMGGTLTIINPATFPMYISSVTLMSTSGSFGALPPACLGGSNVAGSTISGISGPATGGVWGGRRRLLRKLLQWATGNVVNPWTTPTTMTPYGTTGMTGSFLIAAGAQIECLFNITAGSGSPPQGQVYAQATTTSSFVTSTGNTAISSQIQVDFNNPTQQWDIAECVTFSDNAVTQGAAGVWAPQVSGLPQQTRICDSQSLPYSGDISPVPVTGAVCYSPITITNTATAVPDGGAAAATATASVQVMATGCVGASPIPFAPLPVVPSPALPTVAVNPLSAATLVPAIQQPVKVEAAGSFDWVASISSDADAAGRLSQAYSGSRTVQYTVTARRRPAFTYFVSGVISVTNQNSQSVSASSVSAQLPFGYVLAACGKDGRFPVVIAAGASIQCAFNATLIDPQVLQGSVSATAVSSFGTSTSAASAPYTLEPPKSAKETCVVVSDSVTARPGLPQSSLVLTGSRPYAAGATPTCTDLSYNVTARFGPFDATACNMFTVTAEAAATPPGSPASSSSARNTLQLYVEGCPATALSVNTVQVSISPPAGRSVPSVRWAADTGSDWSTTMQYSDSKQLMFNVSWTRTDALDSRLSGTVVITNPTSAPVSIQAAAVQVDFSGSDRDTEAAAAAARSAGDDQLPSLDVQCKEATLAPRASVNCSYSGTIPGGGAGTVRAEVQLTGGRTVTSSPTAFTLTRKAGAAASTLSDTQSCADITTGLFLSPLLVAPNQTLPNDVQQFKACHSGSRTVPLTLGPFTEEACGTYTVVMTTRIRSPDSSGQLPFASLNPSKVVVIGCPLSEVARPEADISVGNISNVARYSWRVTASSDSADPLVVQQRSGQDVSVQVDVVRERRYTRSVALEGAVELFTQGNKPLTVSSVKAAVLKRLGELQVVDAACPASAVDKNGLITIPKRPDRLLCSFSVGDLPPMGGAITPLVYRTEDSTAPLPALTETYKVAGAPQVPLGECAVLGASRSLRKQGAAAAVEGQPSSKAQYALPAQPVCSDFSTTLPMTFGPFGSSQCGRYQFTGIVTATPVANPAGLQGVEGAKRARATVSFNVDVTGCPGSTRATSRNARGSAAASAGSPASSLRGL